MATVGTGKYTYELIENWAKLPPGETFGNVSAVATDSHDRVYVFQRKDPPVVIFDRDGTYLSCWGIGAFANPHGIYITNDVVYLTDRENNRIQVFAADGQFLTMWTDMRRPLDISMDRDGILCISEGAVNGLSPRISLMDKQGNVVARWDSLSAHGSWVDAHGDIYLALGARERVDKYVRQG
jgi:DNA-binding beta-propeller fold protein YncE